MRAVVLGAQGPVFCAGHDLRELATRDPAVHERVFAACAELMLTIHRLPQPVIARVQGTATAAGCQLVAACDLAVAAESARFATPGVKIGLFCTSPMVEVARVVGRTRAMELLLTGEPIDANAALRWGLVNRVVPLGTSTTRRPGWPRGSPRPAARPWRIGKRAVHDNLGLPLEEAYRHASGVMCRNAATDDAQEGIAAFLEKRPAGLGPVTPQRTDPAADFAALREDLGELATLVLAQVERAIGGWEDSDPSVAEAVAEGDREIDLRSAALESRILSLHQNWSTFASDLRLLHVGLIAAVALERVGNLAVSIARLAG